MPPMLATLLALCAALASESSSGGGFVCTCACCETCPKPAEDVGSFVVSSCDQCTDARCSAALPLPVGGCPAVGTPGATVRATCTAAAETPYITVTQYVEDDCTTAMGPAATYIVDHCYTRVDASGMMDRWGCQGRQTNHTQWFPSFNQPPPAPGCAVAAEGVGPINMGAPGGACTLSTPGNGVRAVFSGGDVCPGETPPPCRFDETTRRCDPACPELPGRPSGEEKAVCGCSLMAGYCTSNPDANCQIPRCCSCCNAPCPLQPDPVQCCMDFPTCCIPGDDET